MAGAGERLVVLPLRQPSQPIEHHIDAAPIGSSLDGVGETVVGADDRNVAAIVARHPGFFVTAPRPDDPGAEMLAPLPEEGAPAAAGGVDQNRFPAPHGL